MKERKDAILFVIDSARLYNLVDVIGSFEAEDFKKELIKKKNAENAKEIVIVLTSTKEDYNHDYLVNDARNFREALGSDIIFFAYSFPNAVSNIDLSNVTSRQMEYIINRNKYGFILDAINKVNKKYNVVYTGFTQGFEDFDENEEFQARETIENINKICKFDLLMNNGSVKNTNGAVYNDHLVVSNRSNIKGLSEALELKMDIDNGVILPFMNYREFYTKNKNYKNNIHQGYDHKKGMLIMVDIEENSKYDTFFGGDLWKSILAKKEEASIDDVYIVIFSSNKEAYDKTTFEGFAKNIKENTKDTKVYIKRAKQNTEQRLLQSVFGDDYVSFLEHAKDIKKEFEESHHVNLSYVAYFANAKRYSNINARLLGQMRNSKIDFYAHSATDNIEGVKSSSGIGMYGLSQCLKLSMNTLSDEVINFEDKEDAADKGVCYTKRKSYEEYDDDELPF